MVMRLINMDLLNYNRCLAISKNGALIFYRRIEHTGPLGLCYVAMCRKSALLSYIYPPPFYNMWFLSLIKGYFLQINHNEKVYVPGVL